MAQVQCPCGTPTMDRVFVLAPLAFFPCVQSGYILEPAVPSFQECAMLGSQQSTMEQTVKAAHQSISVSSGASRILLGFGLGLFYFVFVFSSSFSRRDVQCFTQIQIWHSLKRCNAISITLKWEKCKVVFPFSPWVLKKRVVGVRAVSGLSLPALAMWLSWLHCPRCSALSWRREALRHREAFVPWAQCHLINLFSGVDFIPSVYVCKY